MSILQQAVCMLCYEIKNVLMFGTNLLILWYYAFSQGAVNDYVCQYTRDLVYCQSYPK